mmetsp:Transcript_33080/g.43549  ORF Transcript_33080/g.43549 Transcript_33080/m.43549 type:complete len:195 (+) Transcript_33080:3-587(+)
MMGGGPMDGSLGALHGLHQSIASLSQVVELLGMNGHALGYLSHSFMNILEGIGTFIAHLQPWQKFPPGHPRHGEPPPTEEEERKRLNRVRMFRFAVTLLIMYLGYRSFRKLLHWFRYGKQVHNRMSNMITDGAASWSGQPLTQGNRYHQSMQPTRHHVNHLPSQPIQSTSQNPIAQISTHNSSLADDFTSFPDF